MRTLHTGTVGEVKLCTYVFQNIFLKKIFIHCFSCCSEKKCQLNFVSTPFERPDDANFSGGIQKRVQQSKNKGMEKSLKLGLMHFKCRLLYSFSHA